MTEPIQTTQSMPTNGNSRTDGLSTYPLSPNNQPSPKRMLKLLQLVLAACALWAASAAVTAEARTCLRGPNCWYWPRSEGRIVRYYPQHQEARMRMIAERRAANHHGGGW
jgi:hypothetical protein